MFQFHRYICMTTNIIVVVGWHVFNGKIVASTHPLRLKQSLDMGFQPHGIAIAPAQEKGNLRRMAQYEYPRVLIPTPHVP